MNNTPKTPLDICNLALKKLGEPPISSFNPLGSLPERMCYQNYHIARRKLLCATRWNFATHTQKRQFDTTFNGTHSYPLPMDCLRVWEPTPVGRTIRNRVLYCSEPEITFVYTTDEEDVTKFSPEFIEAFTLLLAAAICMPLTHSIMLCGKLTNEYNKLITTITQ